MEFVILERLASNRELRNGIVLKGGNALRFAYQGCRSTKDLDFTVVDDDQAVPDNEEDLVKVGYIFSNDKHFHNFEERNVSDVVPLEISFGDMVCEKKPLKLVEHETSRLMVCSLEDIIAEKLRALLQQPVRKRDRTQDVYDIARCRQQFADKLDLSKIADFLLRKSSIRTDIEVRKSRFDNEIRDMAKAGSAYDKMIADQAAAYPINFDVAWNEVLTLVQSLDIPE